VRAFLAVPLDDAVRARVEALLERLRGSTPRVRWTRPESLHLTLRFLGAATGEQLSRLVPEVRRAAAACPPGTVPVSGLGFFPERGAPRVMWLGLRPPEPLVRMQAELEQAAQQAGFEPESRPWRPHLTLGRFAERGRRPAIPVEDLGAAALREVVLFRSDLAPGGAVHTPLERFPLGGDRSPT
jgi:2'-5' RNA ligase